MHHTMTDKRYDELMTEDSSISCVLTEEELNEGWHWCLEWDDLLIHPNDTTEYSFCRCEGFEKFAEEVRRTISKSDS